MKLRLFISLLMAISLGHSSAFSDFSASKDAVHRASGNIEKNADVEKISNALYEQLRPRVNITNSGLSLKEVDESVRQYVRQQYAPVLIDNYSHIYNELRESNRDFSDCEEPESFNPNSDVLKALCLEIPGDVANVGYLTNGYSRGWSETLVFVFEIEEDQATLVEVILRLGEGVKVHVPGI